MKKKLVSLAVLLGAVTTLGACSKTEESGKIIEESNTETIATDDSGDVAIEENTELKDDGYFKVLVRDGSHPKIKDIVSYDTDYSNSEWDNITLAVDHAKIVTVTDFKDNDDNEYKELISLKYKLTNENSIDKHITPESATLVLEDGTEVDAKVFLDYWDDEVLTKDKHKDGYIHFKIKDETDLKQVKQINVTFKAKADDQETTHTYTIDLPVQ